MCIPTMTSPWLSSGSNYSEHIKLHLRLYRAIASLRWSALPVWERNPLWNQDDLTTGLLHNWTYSTCNIFILQWATSFCEYLVPTMSVLKVELTSINDGSVTHAWLLLGSTVIATCSYGNGGILTLWHENAFRITGPLWGEFTGNRRFPPTNGQSCRVLVFSLLLVWISCRTNSRVTVMTWWRHCNGTRQIF